MDAIRDLDRKKIQIGDAIRYLENLEGKCSLRYIRFQLADERYDLNAKSRMPSAIWKKVPIPPGKPTGNS